MADITTFVPVPAFAIKTLGEESAVKLTDDYFLEGAGFGMSFEEAVMHCHERLRELCDDIQEDLFR